MKAVARVTIAEEPHEECVTLGNAGNGAGENCKFPFIHAGVTYNHCTKDATPAGSKMPNGWCAVAVNSHGVLQKWGECPATCIDWGR